MGYLVHRAKVFLEGDAPDYRIKSEDGICDESVVVVTASLAPGKYELFDFYLDFSNGAFSQAFSSAQPFSSSFEVRSGEVADLGNYFALPRYGVRYLGVRPRAGALLLGAARGHRGSRSSAVPNTIRRDAADDEHVIHGTACGAERSTSIGFGAQGAGPRHTKRAICSTSSGKSCPASDISTRPSRPRTMVTGSPLGLGSTRAKAGVTRPDGKL